MCGIAGIIDLRLTGDEAALSGLARRMADAIAHRGPDGSGVFVDAACGLALAHRRLAIVDLTASGAQPMASSDGRFVISYNGEVYNAEDVRQHPALAGIGWRGHSDTEVIVESVACRGLSATIADLNGMFAIAIWDRRERILTLVRDRLGIKPLFLAVSTQRAVFASELKSLMAIDAPRREIDPSSLASFFRFGYVPAPHTIFKGVTKLEPGECVTIDLDGLRERAAPRRQRYWSLLDVAQRGIASPLEISDVAATDRLADLLQDAVSRQMMGDVPLGAFLSGGIDSSAVAALMVAARKGPVRTFSIGFGDFGFDELPHAAAVAAHLGTDHTELKVTAADALGVIPLLPKMYDEPFADSSQIPTYLVSKLTRDYVTVALSGDGGDELFGGYNRYRLAEGLARNLGRFPRGLRHGISGAIQGIPVSTIDAAARYLPARFLPVMPGDKLHKFASILPLDEEGIYRRLVSQCPNPAELVRGALEHPLAEWPRDGNGPIGSLLDRMQILDTTTYLPDDILQKVDRASMAVALEARPPLLDHRVVEFAWRLPRRFKIRDGEAKWLLRRVLDRHVPRALIDRPKMGFGIPLGAWLRGPLRDWAEDLLNPARLGGGLIDVQSARRIWHEHLAERGNHGYALWTILMFEAWRRRWMP